MLVQTLQYTNSAEFHIIPTCNCPIMKFSYVFYFITWWGPFLSKPDSTILYWSHHHQIKNREHEQKRKYTRRRKKIHFFLFSSTYFTGLILKNLNQVFDVWSNKEWSDILEVKRDTSKHWFFRHWVWWQIYATINIR